MTKTHGGSAGPRRTRLYNIWRGMKKRCNPAKAHCHPKYAGRGISVCAEWQTFEPFRSWALANGYAETLTIERNDNDGPYAPGNCSWIPAAEQAFNRRNSRRVTFRGRTELVSEWARITGFNDKLIYARLYDLGWSVERALTWPIRSGTRRGFAPPAENMVA
jgi:hypothetical protein